MCRTFAIEIKTTAKIWHIYMNIITMTSAALMSIITTTRPMSISTSITMSIR